MSEKQPPLRQRQAKATKGLIIEASRKLFLERGYANSTIESIASQAGVAASTVYAIFGSKRSILRAIRQTWHERSQIKEFLALDHSGVKPSILLDGLALATRRQWETGMEVIAIYRGASEVDLEARDELAEALAGRRRGLDGFTLSLQSHLRPSLDIPRASAILRSLCLPEVYEELVKRSGWSSTEYQEWLASVLKRELLAI